MTRTQRALAVLDLFSESRSTLTAADVAVALAVGRATAYRCIADLEAGGLLERSDPGAYVLGPAIVAMDRVFRSSDPLVGSAAPVMRTLASSVGGRVLLCRLYRHQALCVHDEVGSHAAPAISYERGKAMPLYRGASSRSILCHLSRSQLARLIHEDEPGLLAAGLPVDVAALERVLEADRRLRVCRSKGEVDAQVTAWASPLWEGRQLLGSLSVVIETRHVCERALTIEDGVLRAARRIEGRLREI